MIFVIPETPSLNESLSYRVISEGNVVISQLTGESFDIGIVETVTVAALQEQLLARDVVIHKQECEKARINQILAAIAALPEEESEEI